VSPQGYHDVFRRHAAVDTDLPAGPVGPHEHDAGDVSGVFSSVKVAGDIWSTNWDGALPADLSAGADAAATLGFYLDASAGAIQTQMLYAEGGELGSLTVVGTLSLAGSGKLVTTASGQRVEITAASADRITWYSGAADEIIAAYLQVYATGTTPYWALRGPSDDTGVGLSNAVKITMTPGALVFGRAGALMTITSQGSMLPSPDNSLYLGSSALSWAGLYAYDIYDEAAAKFADLNAQTEAAHNQAWTAVTTAPTDFTITAGFQSRTGRRVTAHAIITCDATFAVGSGIYIFACPVAPSASYTASGGAGNGDTLGTIRLWDSSVGTYYEGHLTYRSSTGGGSCHAVFDGQTARWGHTGNPVAPAASDVLVLAWDYLAAAA